MTRRGEVPDGITIRGTRQPVRTAAQRAAARKAVLETKAATTKLAAEAQEIECRAKNLQQMIAVMQAEMIDCLVRAAFVRRERREHQDE